MDQLFDKLGRLEDRKCRLEDKQFYIQDRIEVLEDGGKAVPQSQHEKFDRVCKDIEKVEDEIALIEQKIDDKVAEMNND